MRLSSLNAQFGVSIRRHRTSPDLAARAKYPAGVEVETLDDGAALVTLCEEPLEKTDAEGMARLHALEAALCPIQS